MQDSEKISIRVQNRTMLNPCQQNLATAGRKNFLLTGDLWQNQIQGEAASATAGFGVRERQEKIENIERQEQNKNYERQTTTVIDMQ